MTKLIQVAIQHLQTNFQDLDERRFVATHSGKWAYRRLFHDRWALWVDFWRAFVPDPFLFDSRFSVAIGSMVCREEANTRHPSAWAGRVSREMAATAAFGCHR
jgi:hypothetical protein